MGFLEELKAGRVSRDIRKIAAENAIPLSLREQFEVLAFLLNDLVNEIAEAASVALEEMPRSSVISYLSLRDANPELLHFYGEISLEARDYQLIETIVKNPSTKDETLIELAGKGDSKMLEIISYNQVRTLSNKKLIDTIVSNPSVSIRVKALLEEWLRLYYSTNEDLEAIETVEEIAKAEVLEEIEEVEGEEEDMGKPRRTLEEKKDIYRLTWNEISKLPVPAKIKLALIGSKTHRAVLIRDPNKVVVEAVLESPKLTEDEIDGFTKMKSIPSEVVKKISSTREWIRNYTVIVNLARHPKTPPQIAMNFLLRLRQKELRDIANSKEVPEVIRREAKRLLNRKK